MTGRPPRPAIERFVARHIVSNGHWLWTGPLDKDGYGRMWDGHTNIRAHRWSYLHHVGPIPDGCVIDHLCRVRHCVNPEHLEPVTSSENTVRSWRSRGFDVACGRGHPRDLFGVRSSSGILRCRECNREDRYAASGRVAPPRRSACSLCGHHIRGSLHNVAAHEATCAQQAALAERLDPGARTHCRRGHDFATHGRVRAQAGKVSRECRECRRLRQLDRQQAMAVA